MVPSQSNKTLCYRSIYGHSVTYAPHVSTFRLMIRKLLYSSQSMVICAMSESRANHLGSTKRFTHECLSNTKIATILSPAISEISLRTTSQTSTGPTAATVFLPRNISPRRTSNRVRDRRRVWRRQGSWLRRVITGYLYAFSICTSPEKGIVTVFLSFVVDLSEQTLTMQVVHYLRVSSKNRSPRNFVYATT